MREEADQGSDTEERQESELQQVEKHFGKSPISVEVSDGFVVVKIFVSDKRLEPGDIADQSIKFCLSPDSAIKLANRLEENALLVKPAKVLGSRFRNLAPSADSVS